MEAERYPTNESTQCEMQEKRKRLADFQLSPRYPDYSVIIRQAPFKGRESGLKQPYLQTHLFPPLILQLEFNKSQTIEQLASYCIICNVRLKNVENSVDLTTLANEYYSKYPYTPNLTGVLTLIGKVLLDPDDKKPKIFFIFEDLNIKVVGDYIFECTVVNMKNSTTITILSKPFAVALRSGFIKSTIKTALTQGLETQLPGKRFKSNQLK
ncbi:hypothetical protein HDV06_007064 [Boothiomyces sp. JEL0866]|nr:hypothetical protein HDV06_007064 [Boothiomyces sp. JEL0866]